MTLKDVTNCRFEKKTSNDHQTQSDDQNPTIERHDNSILFSSKSYSFAAVFFLQIPNFSAGETSTNWGQYDHQQH